MAAMIPVWVLCAAALCSTRAAAEARVDLGEIGAPGPRDDPPQDIGRRAGIGIVGNDREKVEVAAGAAAARGA